MHNKNLGIISLFPRDSVRHALAALTRNKPEETNIPAGIVLVTRRDGKLDGIATDGDIRRALSRGATLDTPMKDVMNKNVFTVLGPKEPTEILAEAVATMRERGWHRHRLDRVVVVDKSGHPIDLVSLLDLSIASDIRFKRIAIVGLGYVGLTLGLTLADLGFRVHGYDIDKRVRELLLKKRSPLYEEGIDTLLADHIGKNFLVIPNLAGVHSADVYFVAVGTPLNEKKRPQMDAIMAAAHEVGSVLKHGDAVVLRSTVPIGTTRRVFIPILEKVSGLSAGEDFFIAFAPERTIEGVALRELRTLPQVIGGINRMSANIASSIFNTMTDTVLLVDTLEEAEIVKLMNNTYRDVSFAFANEIALICRRFGIDTNKVIHAANTGYTRSNIPTPSPGVGGYCLEKDPHIFMESARSHGYTPLLFRDARVVNERILASLGDDVMDFLKERKKIGKGKNTSHKVFILGFAFKGKTPTTDMRGSPTLTLVERLKKEKNIALFGHDPLIAPEEIKALGVTPVKALEEGFARADAVIVMIDPPQYRNLNMRTLMRSVSPGALLFDTWALYNRDEVEKIAGVDYRRL